MPARRLLVRKIREVLRLKHERGLSHRAIAQACAIGVGTVSLYLQRTAQRGLGWPLPAELDDAVLEARLFRRAAPAHDRGGAVSVAGIATASASQARYSSRHAMAVVITKATRDIAGMSTPT